MTAIPAAPPLRTLMAHGELGPHQCMQNFDDPFETWHFELEMNCSAVGGLGVAALGFGSCVATALDLFAPWDSEG
jgi:hypothetical protein